MQSVRRTIKKSNNIISTLEQQLIEKLKNPEEVFNIQILFLRFTLTGLLIDLDFNGIFEELSRLKGSLDLRKSVVVDVINECLRFKRRVLADLVKQFMNSLGRDPEVL